jgi:hypothetical protein
MNPAMKILYDPQTIQAIKRQNAKNRSNLQFRRRMSPDDSPPRNYLAVNSVAKSDQVFEDFHTVKAHFSSIEAWKFDVAGLHSVISGPFCLSH